MQPVSFSRNRNFAWAHTGTGDIFCGRRLRRGSAAKRSRSVCDHWHRLFYSRCGDDDHLYPLEEEKMAIHRIRKKVRNEYEKAIEQNAQYPADMQHGDDADTQAACANIIRNMMMNVVTLKE